MRIIKLIFLLVLLSSFLKRDNSPLTSSSLLWEITSVENQHKSYLFGTIHLIDKEHFYFPKKLKNIAENAEEFIFELEGLPDFNTISELTKNKKYATLDEFTEEEQKLIFDWFESKMNFQKQQVRALFSSTPPIFISQIITLSQLNSNLSSYEKELFEIADKKPIIGLETFQEQFNLINSIPIKNQANNILKSIKNENEFLVDFNTLVKVYLDQNIDSIHKYIISKSDEIELNTDDFIYKRNMNWIPTIEKQISNSNCFIAVGAGHLGGEKGLISLLKEKNYSVKPIQIAE